MSDLPKGSLAILEIGCGSGQTLAAAKAEGKAAFTAGIEFDAAAAANAKDNADTVIQGDVETLELPFPDHHFDVVIKSEVLEHLVDPWAALRKSRRLLKEDGLLYASSPNVAHISIIKQLLRNRFDYQQAGMTDWTHLRWFTPATYQEMIENAGFRIQWARATSPKTIKQKIVNILTAGIFEHIFVAQIFVKAQASPIDQLLYPSKN